MQDFVIIAGKKYRKGYTTGSCAAAASKAAATMLLRGGILESIEIDTPAGVRLKLPVTDVTVGEEAVKCCVVKDGGDDPDVTTGLKIYAEVRKRKQEGIFVSAGQGIGRVTQPGLKVEVGAPAINPVPMKMIRKEVGEVLKEGEGVDILLSVPGGEEVAKRTYNPRLGIEGGISILGTKGIVEPMSEEAWKESLALELDMLSAKGRDTVVMVFGNYGEDFAENILEIPAEGVVKISNFVGYMLEAAAARGFKQVLLAGHMGKLIKVAAGIFHTHSRVADARMEILCAYAALEGADRDTVEAIYSCNTTDAAARIIRQKGLEGIYRRVVEQISTRCERYVFQRLQVGSVLFNENNALLCMNEKAAGILQKIKEGMG